MIDWLTTTAEVPHWWLTAFLVVELALTASLVIFVLRAAGFRQRLFEMESRWAHAERNVAEYRDRLDRVCLAADGKDDAADGRGPPPPKKRG